MKWDVNYLRCLCSGRGKIYDAFDMVSGMNYAFNIVSVLLIEEFLLLTTNLMNQLP